MGKLVEPPLQTQYPVSLDTPIGIVVPVYNHVENTNLAATIFTIEHCADLPYQLSLGIGPNCVAKNRQKGEARLAPEIEYVLQIDDDVLVPPGFLSKMLSVLEQAASKVGAVSAVMTGPRGEAQNGLFPGNIPPGRVVDALIPGTCFMYNRKRTPVEWDFKYKGSQWEDTDGIMQIRKKGYRTVATGNVQIMHRNPMSGGGVKYWNENKEYFISKWGLLENLT
jgi:hypothetical protein